MLEVKHECKLPFTVLNINKSDRYTFLRYCKGLQYLLRWHDVFRDKRVIDIGAGIGAAYHALRFCQPSELIALEPWDENYDFLSKNYDYDSVVKSGWQEFDFKEGDCLFLRGVTIEDYEDFAKKLHDSKVSDLIMIERFVNVDEDSIYFEDWTHHKDWVPGRFTYDRPIERYLQPSIGKIRGIFYKNGFDLMDKQIYANENSRNKLYTWFSLHYHLRNGAMKAQDEEFQYAKPLLIQEGHYRYYKKKQEEI